LSGLTPFAAVFYPVAVLPRYLQAVAWVLPASHVFEGMRGIVLYGVVRWDHLAAAFALNAAWLVAAGVLFARQVHQARVRGALLSIGE